MSVHAAIGRPARALTCPACCLTSLRSSRVVMSVQMSQLRTMLCMQLSICGSALPALHV